jgi:putative transposase
MGMPRARRYFPANITQHVIKRGINRQPMFDDVDDYVTFKRLLQVTLERYEVDLHAYVLMKNHFHLMMTPRTPTALSSAMHWLGGRYAQLFNQRHGRTGALWEGRFRAWTLGDERYWLTCMRYIELNPVRARLVARPEYSRWSSYRCHALGKEDPLLTAHPLYLALGAGPTERRTAWQIICCVTQTPEDVDDARLASRGRRPLPTPSVAGV